jgi:23S rRNA pseudouridine1911/1915/1917 synthase
MAAGAGRGHDGARRLRQGLVLLHEDADVLVVDKSAGLLSIATGTEQERTVYWILAEYLRTRGEKRRPAMVHRLDRDTSGLMVLAKSEEMKKRFMEHWGELVIERRYLALAEGRLAQEGDVGVINLPLGEDAGGRVVAAPGGIPAVTHWEVLRCSGTHTLLALHLDTGRRNQIRAHLAALGHPVSGDAKYHARSDPLKRLALHAETLAFYHPRTSRPLRFTSPVDWHV